jgi:dTDP-4-dehydrorhamnose reductase
MRVLVTGAGGQLAAAVIAEFEQHGEVVALGRSELDVVDDASVRARAERERPDVIVNCASYNAVDAAEDNPERAFSANSVGVRSLAHAAADVDALLVHYGTDFVFDGRTDRPYREADAAHPESVYGISKLIGEWFAVDAPRHYVLRVESLFGRAGNGPTHGSGDRIISRIQAEEEVPVFVDRTISPTYVVDAAAATRAVVASRLPSGTYHCVNSGCCTWREFAEEAARILGRQPKLAAMTLDTMAFRAKRPKYCALSNALLASHGIAMPDWRDALARCIARGVS